MEKKIIEIKVFEKVNTRKPFTWKDIKDFKFEDDDIIEMGYVEPWENGPDNSGGDHYHITIIRQRLETDDEWQRRLKLEAKESEKLKQRRYETYLKLKKEFEEIKTNNTDEI